MKTRLKVYAHEAVPPGRFMQDMADAVDEANRLGRIDQAKQMYGLLIDHFLVTLGSMSTEKLDKYLSSRRPWKRTEQAVVYRTADHPCLTYGVQANPDGSWTVTALAMCRVFPNGNPEDWWNETVADRVSTL